MSKLPRFPKPKNRDGYYFTPTVDGKTKWVPLSTEKQAALEKYHLGFLVFLLMVFPFRFNVPCPTNTLVVSNRLGGTSPP